MGEMNISLLLQHYDFEDITAIYLLHRGGQTVVSYYFVFRNGSIKSIPTRDEEIIDGYIRAYIKHFKDMHEERIIYRRYPQPILTRTFRILAARKQFYGNISEAMKKQVRRYRYMNMGFYIAFFCLFIALSDVILSRRIIVWDFISWLSIAFILMLSGYLYNGLNVDETLENYQFLK